MFFDGSSRSTRSSSFWSPSEALISARIARTSGSPDIARSGSALTETGNGRTSDVRPSSESRNRRRSAFAPCERPRRQQEVLRPGPGLEADHVGAGHPAHQRLADPDRQQAHVGLPRMGHVGEVDDPRVRPEVAQVPRDQGEVVVLDQEHGVGRRVVEHLGEGPVRLLVRAPGLVRLRVEHRRACDVPQEVAREPEHAVRDLVVVALVDVGIERHEPQLQADGLVDRGLVRHDAVGVGQRRGDPGRLVAVEDAGQRRDEAAGAALRLEPPGSVRLERDGPAVRGDDQRRLDRGRNARFRHHPEV